MKTKNMLLKFVLCAMVALPAYDVLAAKNEDRGLSFVQILCYMIAGGLASAFARRREARKKEGQKGSAGISKTAVLIVSAGVLCCVFAYSIFPIVLVLVLFALPLFLGRRNSSGKGGGGAISDLQDRVDRCLLAGHIVSHGILKEWALIIRFFASGDKPRRLCVPAMLFLWERIFEPKMSHSEILELNDRIKSECGLDKAFSRRNFESTSSDAIRKIGYEPAWRNWQQLGDYAYSASERIGGNSEIKVPSGFGASVYRLLKTWDGKFDQTVLLPIDWKLFFKSHPDLAEHEILVRFGVLDAKGQGECAENVHESVKVAERGLRLGVSERGEGWNRSGDAVENAAKSCGRRRLLSPLFAKGMECGAGDEDGVAA